MPISPRMIALAAFVLFVAWMVWLAVRGKKI